MGKTGFENGQSFQDSSVYNPIKVVPTPGSNLIVDPGFENWLNFYILDSWGNSGTNIQQSTDVPSGLGLNYSAYFSTSGYIYTGYGNGSGTVNTTLWARTGATGTIYFTASYQDNSINYHWNWTGTNAGTYTSNYAPTETVTNGGFEIWTEEYPDTWYFFGDGTCTKETSKVHSGTNAAKITCTTNLSYIDSDLQFSMNIPVGSTVNISLWVAGDAGGETAGFVLYGDNGTVQMAWDWSLNDFTSCPADPTGNQILPLSSLTTSYQNFTQAITYTATYSGSLSPRLYGSASGTVYFDVISIQAMQDQGANSDQKYYPTLTTSWTQFTIPGFDYNSGDNEIRLISDTGNVYVTLVDPESTGGSGLTLTDWIELSHSTNEVSQSTDSHTGTYAAQLNGTTGNDSGLIQSYTSAPGTGYTLSLWGKGASTSIQVAYTDNALQSAYNFTGTYAGTYTAMSGGPTSDQLATINFTGTYANYTLSAVPPYSSSSFALVILSEDVCVVDTLTLKDQSGNDIAVDGDFELWETAPMISNGNMNTWDATPSNTLADWTQATTDPGFDEGSVNRETTVIHSGSCAVKIISSPSNSHSQRIFEEVHGTAGSPATFKVWATNNGSVGNGQLSFEDGTEIWNFVTLGWDAIGDKGANNVQELVATSAYTQFVFNLTFPASGMIEPMLTTYGFTGSAGTIYYDDAELKEVSPAPLIDAVVLENDSNLGDLLTGDTAFRVHFKGDNKDALRLTPDGELQTDIAGGLKSNSLQKIVEIRGINLMGNNVDYGLYIVPTGKQLFILDSITNNPSLGVAMVVTSMTGSGSSGRYTLGAGRFFNDHSVDATLANFQVGATNCLSYQVGWNQLFDNPGFTGWSGGIPAPWDWQPINTGTISQDMLGGAIINCSATGSGGSLTQSFTGRDNRHFVKFFIDAKCGGVSSGNEKLGFFFLNDKWSNATQMWNFSERTWEAFSGTLGAENKDEFSGLTSSYQNFYSYGLPSAPDYSPNGCPQIYTDGSITFGVYATGDTEDTVELSAATMATTYPTGLSGRLYNAGETLQLRVVEPAQGCSAATGRLLLFGILLDQV